jgi:hypothetical protein
MGGFFPVGNFLPLASLTDKLASPDTLTPDENREQWAKEKALHMARIRTRENLGGGFLGNLLYRRLNRLNKET